MTLFWHMLRKATLLFILSVFTVSAVHAEEGSKNEVGLLLGATVTPTRTLSGQSATVEFGSGLVFQATYARQLSHFYGAALFFELPFVASPLVGLSSSESVRASKLCISIRDAGAEIKSTAAFGRDTLGFIGWWLWVFRGEQGTTRWHSDPQDQCWAWCRSVRRRSGFSQAN
jgi:hypothetical protein